MVIFLGVCLFLFPSCQNHDKPIVVEDNQMLPMLDYTETIPDDEVYNEQKEVRKRRTQPQKQSRQRERSPRKVA